MMSCTTSNLMSNMFKVSKMPSPSHVIEHGLLVGMFVVLINAAITLQTVEVMTGVVGALAVCVMKQNDSKRRNCSGKTIVSKDLQTDCNSAPSLPEVEPTRNFSVADETTSTDTDFAQLNTFVQAELTVLRAECQLESWRNKADAAEAELTQLHDNLSELETELSQAHPDELRIEALLSELMETKLKIEEVEMELVQAQIRVADLEGEVSQAAPTYANDDLAMDVASTMWMVDEIQVPLPSAVC